MKYTMSYREQVTLTDGTRLQLRAIRPSDKAALADGFAQLSPNSRRRRFHTAKAALSDSELRFLTECDGLSHFAIVAYCNDDSTDEQMGVGVVRIVGADDDPTVAELGITVADAWQGRGVGAALLDRIVAAAAERGFERMSATILADNERMKSLIENSLDHVAVKHERGLLIVDYSISSATPFDATLNALRRLTLGTMTIPLHRREHKTRGLLEPDRTREEKRDEL